jgi:outer membrane immunogenic protein
MKSTFFASTSLIGLLVAPSAFAADLPPIPYKESQSLPWAGAYFGVNVGYAWTADPGIGCSFTGISACTTTAFPAAKPSAPEFGVQAGYNWQVAKWVFGVETDFNYLGMDGVSHFAGVDPSKGPDQTSSRYDWLGTARGRVGVVNGPTLFYATGGLAYGRVGHGYGYALGSTGAQVFSMSENQLGWTVGGGAEYAVDRHWSLKAEYLYVHLAASSLDISSLRFDGNGGTPSGSTILHFNNNLNIVRIGANYRF